MEEKQSTPSVIARLMGLDKKPIQQALHRPQKVLSDEYISKTSSLAVLGKRSHFVDLLNKSPANKIEKRLDDNEGSCNDRESIWSVSDELERRIEFSFSRKRCMHAKTASEIEMRGDSSRFVATDKFAKSNALESHFESNGLSARRGDVTKKLKKYSTSERTIVRSRKFENHGVSRSRSIFRTKMEPASSASLSRILMKSSASTYGSTKLPQFSHDFSSSLVFHAKTEMKNFEPLKGKRLYPELAKPITRQGINSKVHAPTRIYRKKGLRTDPQRTLRPKLSVLEPAEIGTSTKLQIPDCMTEDSEKQLDRREHLQCSDSGQVDTSSDLHCSETEQSSPVSDLASTSWITQNESTTSYEDGSSELAPGTFLEKDGFSDVHGNSKICISGCQYGPDLVVISGEAYQPTPDSVLEPPFKEDVGSIADLRGLAMRLHLLDSMSDETNSVCSVMDVSSDDEDTETASCVLPQNSGNSWEMTSLEESRDFSYVIDVLDEADISDENLHQLWQAEEFALDISVFELLEKKYGKQTSWQKSVRRLLFDRVNSLLNEILHSFSYFNIKALPLKRRFRPGMTRADIEDKLWSLLVVQGKEISEKDLDEKALTKEMKWLELEEDVMSICIEIEQQIFHELVAELVSEYS